MTVTYKGYNSTYFNVNTLVSITTQMSSESSNYTTLSVGRETLTYWKRHQIRCALAGPVTGRYVHTFIQSFRCRSSVVSSPSSSDWFLCPTKIKRLRDAGLTMCPSSLMVGKGRVRVCVCAYDRYDGRFSEEREGPFTPIYRGMTGH